MDSDLEFHQKMKALQTPWYERRFIGRSLGILSFTIGLFGFASALGGLVVKPYKYLFIVSGLGMIILNLLFF
jgi:hypothetical protein